MSNDLVWGRRTVLEFLRSGSPVNRIYVLAEGRGLSRELFELARERNIPVVRSPRDRLDRLAGHGNNHQGVVAQVGTREFLSFQEMMEKVDFARHDRPILLALDAIQDPGNFGAILRTAEAAGVAGVTVSAQNSCGLTAAVSKTAAGADAYLPIARSPRLDRDLKKLADSGFQTVGTLPGAEESLYDLDLRSPTVFVLGGEGSGVDAKVAEACSQRVRLPMLGRVESLNVSVTAGILLYEAVRQRM